MHDAVAANTAAFLSFDGIESGRFGVSCRRLTRQCAVDLVGAASDDLPPGREEPGGVVAVWAWRPRSIWLVHASAGSSFSLLAWWGWQGVVTSLAPMDPLFHHLAAGPVSLTQSAGQKTVFSRPGGLLGTCVSPTDVFWKAVAG